MKPTGGSVAAFVAGVAPDRRRRDADSMIALLREVTGRGTDVLRRLGAH